MTSGNHLRRRLLAGGQFVGEVGQAVSRQIKKLAITYETEFAVGLDVQQHLEGALVPQRRAVFVGEDFRHVGGRVKIRGQLGLHIQANERILVDFGGGRQADALPAVVGSDVIAGLGALGK